MNKLSYVINVVNINYKFFSLLHIALLYLGGTSGSLKAAATKNAAPKNDAPKAANKAPAMGK